MNVVSSFTNDGYDLYGKKFIESFLTYWPESVQLTIYYEGGSSPISDPRVIVKNISEVQFHDYFMSQLTFPIMHGKIGGGYNINYDARMARKVLIQMHAMKTMGGKIFWVDADSITFNQLPIEFLEECLPDQYFNCYLGRDGWYYTESGFIGFNANHQIAESFYNTYISIFLKGLIFTQQGWHDCFGFDLARSQFDKVHFKNLAQGLPHGTMHPFVNSDLGKYMDHRKGPRKTSRSTAKDLVIQREESYWRESKA